MQSSCRELLKITCRILRHWSISILTDFGHNSFDPKVCSLRVYTRMSANPQAYGRNAGEICGEEARTCSNFRPHYGHALADLRMCGCKLLVNRLLVQLHKV